VFIFEVTAYNYLGKINVVRLIFWFNSSPDEKYNFTEFDEKPKHLQGW